MVRGSQPSPGEAATPSFILGRVDRCSSHQAFSLDAHASMRRISHAECGCGSSDHEEDARVEHEAQGTEGNKVMIAEPAHDGLVPE